MDEQFKREIYKTITCDLLGQSNTWRGTWFWCHVKIMDLGLTSSQKLVQGGGLSKFIYITLENVFQSMCGILT